MGLASWFRFRRKDTPGTGRVGAVLRAALSGASTAELEELAARALLGAAEAHRAGVWLAGEEDPDRLEGTVVADGSAPAAWQPSGFRTPMEFPVIRPGSRDCGTTRLPRSELDNAAPYLKVVLASADPVVVDLRSLPQGAVIDVLRGMCTAIWIPLRWREKTLGLAVVAYAFPRRLGELGRLRALADELALAAALHRAERNAARAKTELEGVLESVENGVVLLDTSRQVRFANARFAHLMGLEAGSDRAAAAGLKTLAALSEALRDWLVKAEASRTASHPSTGLPSAAPARPCPSGRRAAGGLRAGGEPVAGRARNVREELLGLDPRGNETVWEDLELPHPVCRGIKLLVRPLRDRAGGHVGWVGVFREAGAQPMVQSRMVHTEKMAVLGRLLSGIAHELNNPLTSILGYAQLLLSHGAAPNHNAELLRVYQEADRARQIVQHVLLFARQAEPERRPVDLNEIIEQTVTLRSYELKLENIAVELDLAPGLPPIFADLHQLQQVVLNLVLNAEQAILRNSSEEGRPGGRIRIRARAAAANRLRLEVSDDGPGVPREIASRIFDPFFTTKPLHEGTGLGLSIAYGIVQRHGGRIYLAKEHPPDFSTGATFAVELPAMVSEVASPPEPAQAHPAGLIPAAAAGHPPAAGKLRVLVVEDEPTVAQLITDVLSEEGHEVEAVLDGAEGLERVLRQPCDLVICDLKMPRLDGQAFYEALMQAGSPARQRVLFITGDTLARRTLDFLDRHSLPYVAKPFQVEELKRAVHQVLESLRAEPRSDAPGGEAERIALGSGVRVAAGAAPKAEAARRR